MLEIFVRGMTWRAGNCIDVVLMGCNERVAVPVRWNVRLLGYQESRRLSRKQLYSVRTWIRRNGDSVNDPRQRGASPARERMLLQALVHGAKLCFFPRDRHGTQDSLVASLSKEKVVQ